VKVFLRESSLLPRFLVEKTPVKHSGRLSITLVGLNLRLFFVAALGNRAAQQNTAGHHVSACEGLQASSAAQQ